MQNHRDTLFDALPGRLRPYFSTASQKAVPGVIRFLRFILIGRSNSDWFSMVSFQSMLLWFTCQFIAFTFV